MALSNNPISHVLLLLGQKLGFCGFLDQGGSLGPVESGLRFIKLGTDWLFRVLAFVKLNSRSQVFLVAILQLGVCQHQLSNIPFSIGNDIEASKCIVLQ